MFNFYLKLGFTIIIYKVSKKKFTIKFQIFNDFQLEKYLKSTLINHINGMFEITMLCCNDCNVR